jgi:hypothetical protein
VVHFDTMSRHFSRANRSALLEDAPPREPTEPAVVKNGRNLCLHLIPVIQSRSLHDACEKSRRRWTHGCSPVARHLLLSLSLSLFLWFRAVASTATQGDDEPVETPPDGIFLPPSFSLANDCHFTSEQNSTF